ncbi:PIN domain-containing protein, partial [Acidithiobacillus thiooxidans]|uniref:PIN domain-containing protein n=1 Tax=Acidithiobacillus thiooxidans TaxID=930 RepID=UPI001C06E752
RMKRFVFDTDVIVSAMRSPSGASAALVEAALDGYVAMLASVPLTEICGSSLHWKAAGLSQEEAHIYVSGLAAIIEPVTTYYLWRPMLR